MNEDEGLTPFFVTAFCALTKGEIIEFTNNIIGFSSERTCWLVVVLLAY